MEKDRLAKLEEWLTLFFGEPLDRVCLNCPPKEVYFPARVETVEWKVRGVEYSKEYYRPATDWTSVPTIGRKAAVLAVVLALRGVGVDPQRVERHIQEQDHPQFRLKEGEYGFACCINGKKFLAAVADVLD